VTRVDPHGLSPLNATEVGSVTSSKRSRESSRSTVHPATGWGAKVGENDGADESVWSPLVFCSVVQWRAAAQRVSCVDKGMEEGRDVRALELDGVAPVRTQHLRLGLLWTW